MENNQSSQIVSDRETQDEITSGGFPEQIIETQPVAIDSQKNNALQLKKWIIAGGVVVLTIAVCIFLAKETDVCFMSTCNHYSDSTGSETSIGNDFVAYAGGAATLLVLTTLVGIPLLPAVAISTGVWFVLQMIR